jgi:hypothetical protein
MHCQTDTDTTHFDRPFATLGTTLASNPSAHHFAAGSSAARPHMRALAISGPSLPAA